VTAPRSIILGTAGHIDHGKTSLVKALTGIDTDRLKEERRRGITIELGFAHLRLGDVLFGIVDVPGHERFIKSMVAGAGGIDIVMLVVAADEGVMPQTREHLDICQLLGVKRGLVALTKSDLVDPDWLDLVEDDLRQTFEPTFLADAPILRCSATEAAGLEPLKEALLTLAAAVDLRDPDGLLRLPLDRVFTIKGFGTVVTGTLLAGTLRPGDEVAVLPANVKAKVRSVQVHGEEQEQAVAGQRTAVNLGGVDRQSIGRGEVLIHPGTLAPSPMIDAEVSLLPGARKPLPARSKVLFHVGTRQQEATCSLLNVKRLEPGEAALAQLSFELPVVALPADRFILRGFQKQENYGTTLGGGEVLRVLSRRLRPRNTAAWGLLEGMAAAPTAERVALELQGAGPIGLTRAQLQQRLPYVPRELDKALTRLRSGGQAVVYDKESGAAVHGDHFAALRARTLELVDGFHADNPLERGVGREELRSRLGPMVNPRLFFTLQQQLSKQGELEVERDLCYRPGHTVQAAAGELRPLADKILQLYDRAGLGPPLDSTLAGKLSAEGKMVADALKLLVDAGSLIKVTRLYFVPRHLEELQRRLVELLREQGEINPTQFKELVGQSRKFTIPLAEYFDAQKVTLRVGDARKLRG
jgi:selenocysteine-specific elongation factor